MEYKAFGNTGEKVSRLGFGAMRLPHKGEGREYKLLHEESVELLEKAIEGGINYIDTAYPYCHGKSERIVGEVIKGKRKKLLISSKSPLWLIKKEDDFDRFLEESLEKLDIDCIDFYHLHSLSSLLYEKKVLRYGLIERALKAKEQGLIGHISFSFHDRPEVLKEMIDLGVFESVLCQYNFLDRTNKEAISYAKRKGLGVAVMGPIAGGRILDTAISRDIKREKMAELSLRFVLSNSDIDIAVSGMENTEVLVKNLGMMKDYTDLKEDERALLDEIFSSKETQEMVSCNNCGYCVPCPEDVAIPEIFRIYNYYILTGLLGNSRFQYNKIPEVMGENTAGSCTECGECETKCPQKIDIRDKLKEIEDIFSS